jgi:5-methylcytosine-specific restriction endonuclease McrA
MKRNYDDPVYKAWRIKVYKRDNFTCQMPGCKKKGSVQAHHIEKWSSASTLRFDVDNGISLCRNCHRKVTGHETYYKELFREIIRKKNG